MKLKDFVTYYKNSKNFQEKLEVKKLKLKESNISVSDLLNIEFKVDKKIKRFDEI